LEGGSAGSKVTGRTSEKKVAVGVGVSRAMGGGGVAVGGGGIVGVFVATATALGEAVCEGAGRVGLSEAREEPHAMASEAIARRQTAVRRFPRIPST
jgi:hypothetical protein